MKEILKIFRMQEDETFRAKRHEICKMNEPFKEGNNSVYSNIFLITFCEVLEESMSKISRVKLSLYLDVERIGNLNLFVYIWGYIFT